LCCCCVVYYNAAWPFHKSPPNRVSCISEVKLLRMVVRKGTL
jgi:hypothetical protein